MNIEGRPRRVTRIGEAWGSVEGMCEMEEGEMGLGVGA